MGLLGFLADREGFRWGSARDPGGRRAFDLQSQVWKGGTWRHGLVMSLPDSPFSADTCVLHVTGGPSNEPDLAWADRLAGLSGLTVATLFDIPNQPLWGHREDDLIAHTFEQFLESGDESWPLLMPMVRSAVRAMDAIQEADPSLRRFVVTGASKRGWTSWLTGCSGDPRVAGIAPMVFDFLKMPQQLAKQVRDWGRLSPMMTDYTSRELEGSVETDNGRRLLGLIDPAEHLSGLSASVLLILGANDPYWTVDAHTVYWNEVPTPKAMVMVPNMEHGWGSTDYWTPTLAAFARATAEDTGLESWDIPFFVPVDDEPPSATFVPEGSDVLWTALSPTRDFTDSVWEPRSDWRPERDLRGGCAAVFCARRGHAHGIRYWTTTPVRVFGPAFEPGGGSPAF